MGSTFDIYSLPAEIWTEIFSLACLDNGETSLTLSQVSRAIRSLSESQRYLTIKINSTSQLLKLQDVLASKGLLDTSGQQHPLRTRCLCILLPENISGQADSDDSDAPEDDFEDESSTECHSASDHAEVDLGDGGMGVCSLVSSDSESDEEYDLDDAESGYMMASDVEDGETDAENADLETDIVPFTKTIGSISELEEGDTASSQLEYQIYNAIRRILDACSARLEGFTLWMYPECILPLQVLVPQLPKLTSIGIGIDIDSATWALAPSADLGDPASTPLFPMLSGACLLARYTSPGCHAWWEDVVKLTVRTEWMNFVTSLPKSFLSDIPQTDCEWLAHDASTVDDHCPGWFSGDIYTSRNLRATLVEWWQEDVQAKYQAKKILTFDTSDDSDDDSVQSS